MLGLKFCTAKNPNFKLLKKSTHEALRKISWKIYFLTNPTDKKDSDFLIKCKKDFRKISNKTPMECPITHELFNVSSIKDDLIKFCGKFKGLDEKIFDDIISDFRIFCNDNNLLVIEADKNAGICIVNKCDYDQEVLRQLNDLNTYHPSTNTAFELGMIEFNDKANQFYKKIPENFNLKYLKFDNEQPAKFYILPKVHKAFDKFPKGRPISSTFHKSNKYVSRLLDNILRPCLYEVTDLLIDTQHFLLLLENVTLRHDRNYHLVTVDVEALYPSLMISDCKKHCSESYLRINQDSQPFSLNKRDILTLLGLSLDYNYVSYDNKMFYQHKGIEMGNAASVSIANLTVFHEIKSIFEKDEIVFHKRFLDDIFILLDTTEIMNEEEWLENTIKHRYLKFTHETSTSSINFLDVKVSLNDNKLSTEIFKKPMSKHVYLHSESDHPSHLKNSLFYSQGLRVIRLCSIFSVRTKHLIEMYNKFESRGYDENILHNTLLSLISKDRCSVLKPKKEFLLSYLHRQNPNILENYGINFEPSKEKSLFSESHNVFIIFPFYKCIKSYKHKIIECIRSNINVNCTGNVRTMIENIVFKVVFSRTKNLKEMLKPK